MARILFWRTATACPLTSASTSDLRPHADKHRSADEYRRNRVGADFRHAEFGLKAVHLTAKGIAPYGGVQHAKSRLIRVFNGAAQQDKPGATAIDGHALHDAFAQRPSICHSLSSLPMVVLSPPGMIMAIDAVHILELAHFASRHAQPGHAATCSRKAP